jgi:hypothetical protein
LSRLPVHPQRPGRTGRWKTASIRPLPKIAAHEGKRSST